MGQGITTFSQHFTTQMSPHYPQLEPIYYESRAKNDFFCQLSFSSKIEVPKHGSARNLHSSARLKLITILFTYVQLFSSCILEIFKS